MNPGGEPGRDDSGLPPVDIEIPDDARELDRDMQAYYRELRAERRQQRGLRVRGSLAKDGIVLPLLACCLILALITGTLLTVFTATSDPNLGGIPGAPKLPARTQGPSSAARGATSTAPGSSATSGPPAARTAPPAPSAVPGMLPAGTNIIVGGQPLPVQRLTKAALVLVPPHCNCASMIAWLIYVVTGAHAQPYLVYTASTEPGVSQLYGSLSSADRNAVLLADEPGSGSMLRESIPGSLPEDGLAAILIGPSKHALYATNFNRLDNTMSLIQALTH